uniref:Uncharacterized protein n=1 Tax=Aegilops tauschii TaxID=37682 RepID=M8CNT9_AEGTA
MWPSCGDNGTSEKMGGKPHQIKTLLITANGRYRRWKTGVSVDGDYITTMARWAVERIPRREGAPALPPPIPIRVQGRLSGIIFGRQEREAWRTIRFFTENGFSQGLYPENGWHEFPFLGRFCLLDVVIILLSIICLPPNCLIVSAAPVYHELRHPDVDARGERSEQES